MTAEYTATSKQGYPIIYRGQKAAVLFRQTPHQPYVVAHGYDEERGDWSQGSYLDDLKEAMMEADGLDKGTSASAWEPDPDFLREASKRLASDAAWPESYYERYLVAATEWYAQCYRENLQELIAALSRDADIDWRLLDDGLFWPESHTATRWQIGPASKRRAISRRGAGSASLTTSRAIRTSTSTCSMTEFLLLLRTDRAATKRGPFERKLS